MTTYEKVKNRATVLNKPISSIEAEAGIANGTISGWRESRPFAETLGKVAKILGVAIEDLLPDREEEPV